MLLTTRLRATLATTLLALLLVASSASAATFKGSVTDPTDSAGPAGTDIRAVDVTYDDAGTASAVLTLDAATASASDTVFVALGTGDATTCTLEGPAALGMGARADGSGPGWVSFVNGANEDGNAPDRTTNITAARSGAQFTVTVADPRIATRGYGCALATIAPAGPNQDSYDGVATFALAAEAAPQPAPTATPTPTAQPTPAPVKPAAKLRATLKGVPKRVKRGKRFRPTLTIANRGNAASKAVTVRFGSARGLSVKPRRITVKGLAPGKAKRVKLRVTLGRKARSTTPFVVSAKGNGLSATTRATLRTKPAKRKTKPKPKPGPTTGGLPGTFWWWNELTSYRPFNVYALRFYDNGYAYYRLPEDGQSVPDRCDSVTSVPDKDGEYGPGCVKWQLDGTKLTFSDPRWTGTYANGKLEIRDAEKSFEVDKFAEPQAGKRYNFSYKNIETTGFCGLPGTYCSVVKSYLTLQDDGTFGLQEESSSTLDTGGSFTYTGSYPPENRGTYEVLSGYRIKLSYADGKMEIVPFGLIDGTSAVDDAVRVVLGRLPFWVETENG